MSNQKLSNSVGIEMEERLNIKPAGKYSGYLSIILICLNFFAFIFPTFSISSAVTAIPNKAVVIGTVKEYSVGSSSLYGMSPEQTIYKLTIIVEGSEDIESFPNFLKGKEGQTLPFFTKEKPSIESGKVKFENLTLGQG